MEASAEPESPPDSPESVLSRPWMDRFRAWKVLIANGCPAHAGPGGIYCSWVGRNCCFNDCPRRNLEKDQLSIEALNKIERQSKLIQDLRNQIKQLNKKINQLKKT